MPDTDVPVRILLRADARPDLGGGHIMRCLSLAAALEQYGCDVAFSCAAGSSDLVPALARSGFPWKGAHSLSACPMPDHWNDHADIIVVDLYDSRIEDEIAMRNHCDYLAVIEDLPVRKHNCDLLIDHGFDRRPATYHSRVPQHCQLLLGPHMIPLRADFARRRNLSLSRRAKITRPHRLLIAMGLTDVRRISYRVYRIARSVWPVLPIDVVLGPHAESRLELESATMVDPHLNILIDVEDMAELMASSDLAIGAGGGTALERCVLGLPSLVIILANNQRLLARAMEKAGACITLDDSDTLSSRLAASLNALDAKAMQFMSKNAATLCYGDGAQHIANALLALAKPRP